MSKRAGSNVTWVPTPNFNQENNHFSSQKTTANYPNDIPSDGSFRHNESYDYNEEAAFIHMMENEPEKVTQMMLSEDEEDEEDEEQEQELEADKSLEQDTSPIEDLKELSVQGVVQIAVYLRKVWTVGVSLTVPALSLAVTTCVLYMVFTRLSIPDFSSWQGLPARYSAPAEVPKDFGQLSSRLKRLESEMTRLGSESETSSEWISANRKLVGGLGAKIEAVEGALGAIDKQTVRLGAAMERLAKDTHLLMGDNSAIANTQRKWVSELESLKHQLIAQREAISTIKASEMDSSPAFALLGSTVERIDGDIARLTSDLDKRQSLDAAHLSDMVSAALDDILPQLLSDYMSEKSFSTDFEEAKQKLDAYITSSISQIKSDLVDVVSSIEIDSEADEMIERTIQHKISEIDLEEFLRKDDLHEAIKGYVDSKLNSSSESDKPRPSKDGSEFSQKVINFASLIHGAKIDPELTTALYDPWKGRSSPYCLFRNTLSTFGLGKPMVRRPWVALISDMSVGSCWPFNGRKGQLAVKLAAPMLPSALSIKHVAATDSVQSAPRFFNFWIRIDDPQMRVSVSRSVNSTTTSPQARASTIPAEFVSLGQFEFDPAAAGPAGGWYPVPLIVRQLDVQTNEAIFEFVENWGHEQFTCVYQVGVHGTQAPVEVSSEAQGDNVIYLGNVDE